MRQLASIRTVVSGCGAIIAVATATPAASAQETAERYVVADVVRVRAAPVKDAKVIANLRIGTPVKVAYDGAAPEGWSKVVLDTAPPLTGYLASAFLSPEAPKAADLLARYEAAMAAGNLDDAKTAAERLVALQPDTDEHLERLKALYAKLGDTDGALRIDTHLEGAGIKYIGICGGRLLASYQPGGGLTPWVTTHFLMKYANGNLEYQSTKFDAPRLPALRLGLQRSPLFVFEPSTGKNNLLPAAYMLNAGTVRANWDEAKTGETASGASLNLPGCGKNGGIVSNEPMEPVTFNEADWSRVGEFIGNHVANDKNRDSYVLESLNARMIGGPHPLAAVRARAENPNDRRDEYGASIWRLFDAATGERLAGSGAYYRPDAYSSVADVTWFKWRGSEARVAVVEYGVYSDGSDNGSYADVVVIEEDKTVRTLQLKLNWIMGD